MRSSRQGLTLVEVMVALAFTGIAFTALALSQVTGFKVTRNSQEAAIAKDLAHNRLEVFRAYGFHPFALCPTIDPEDLDPAAYAGYPPCEGSATSSEYPAFDVAWSLSNRPQGTPQLSKPALIEVRVLINWPEGAKMSSYAVTSYLSCGDPGAFASTDVPCPKESLGPW
jgi:type II secretory pathway pseudopilin PulG